MTSLNLDDDGFCQLLVKKYGAKPTDPPEAITIDVFAEYNQLYVLRRNEREAAEREGRLPLPSEVCQKYLNDKFSLGCSVKFAAKLYDALGTEVERLQKKDPSEGTASTQRPSDSPSGPTPDEPTPPASSNGV